MVLPMMTMTTTTATTKMLMHAVKPRSHSNHSVVPFTAAHLGLGLWLGAIRRFNHLTKLRTIDVPPPASPPLSGDPELDRPPDRPLAHCEARPPPAAAERAVRGTGLRVPVGGFFFPMGGGRGFRCFFCATHQELFDPRITPPPNRTVHLGAGGGWPSWAPKNASGPSPRTPPCQATPTRTGRRRTARRATRTCCPAPTPRTSTKSPGRPCPAPGGHRSSAVRVGEMRSLTDSSGW